MDLSLPSSPSPLTTGQTLLTTTDTRLTTGQWGVAPIAPLAVDHRFIHVYTQTCKRTLAPLAPPVLPPSKSDHTTTRWSPHAARRTLVAARWSPHATQIAPNPTTQIAPPEATQIALALHATQMHRPTPLALHTYRKEHWRHPCNADGRIPCSTQGAMDHIRSDGPIPAQGAMDPYRWTHTRCHSRSALPPSLHLSRSALPPSLHLSRSATQRALSHPHATRRALSHPGSIRPLPSFFFESYRPCCLDCSTQHGTPTLPHTARTPDGSTHEHTSLPHEGVIHWPGVVWDRGMMASSTGCWTGA